MALYIKIEKILEENDIAYYYLVTQAFGGAEFYIGIDKDEKKIYCYFTKDLSGSVKIIDCNDPNERFDNLPEVNSSILIRVVRQAFKVFKLNEYPQYLDYAA